MTKQELQILFQRRYDRNAWSEFLHACVGVERLRVTPKGIVVPAAESSRDMKGWVLGEFDTPDNYKIGLFEFSVPGDQASRRRVGLRNILVPWLKSGDFDAAIAVFHSTETPVWRVSFICDLKGAETAAKRFTFVFGDSTSQYRTATDRFAKMGRTASSSPATFSAIREAFSVEALSKEFYAELYDWYARAISEAAGVYFPNDPENNFDDREKVNIKIIRLITRILFVWFIRQKHLVPANLFTIGTLKVILKDFDPLSHTSGNYYNAILQNLFFATLNSPIVDEETGEHLRRFASGREQQPGNLYRYAEMFAMSETEALSLFERIPYMNGGLFECLDKPKSIYREEFAKNGNREMLYDGFSRSTAKDPKSGHFKRRAFIPNYLFFDSDEIAPGLFPLLNRYNFTVEENSVNDADVSLDPELLGRVFENLLASYNPETQVTARNATGSFYTPREIVDYMVKESLDAYMRPARNKAPKEQLKHLLGIKVLDPACGSGAFPMGMLHAIVERAESLKSEARMDFDRYATKLEVIKRCIFGVDIQSIAMMITKLRFFISLICEQGEPTGEKQSNYGIEPLPNLETKFVAANSLISAQIRSIQRGLFDGPLETMKNELFKIRERYSNERCRSKKLRIPEEDKAKCKTIHDYLIQNSRRIDEAEIVKNEKELIEAERQYEVFKVADWRDATESPQEQSLFPGFEADVPIQKSLFKVDANERPRKLWAARIREIKKNIAREKASIDLDAFSHAVCEVTEWRPYDQVAVSPFFDSEWMFGVKDGFDVVIGNPPYIQLQSEHGKLGDLYKSCRFETFAKTGDIYCLFYERGWQLLKPNGHLCYITSNKWMRAGYGEATRKFFAEKTNPELLIDFAGEKIFESATVDTNILLFEKGSKNSGKTMCCIGASDGRKDLSVFVKQTATPCAFTSSDSWVILSPIEQSIKHKIESAGIPLKDWGIQINYGIKTGCNEAFIIDEEKRSEILVNCRDAAERKRTEQIIRPILRGRDIKRYGHDWAGLYLIATHNGIPEKGIERIDINDYPSIKRHLDVHWEKIASRSDMGDTPYNLRSCAYMDDFNKPKIVWGNLSLNAAFAKAPAGMFINAPCAMITPFSDYLLAILNSKLGDWYIRQLGVTRNGGYFEYKPMFVEQLPVPKSPRVISSDRDVYELYGLDECEISFIEESSR